ncbi:M48 family metalloprotease [Sorangium sp. So ce363]|uniref:M48 family metalloprotease n=1 Tax=Sorangium sp. So ce363 TaxID=3133304 RepID=UPI003F643311
MSALSLLALFAVVFAALGLVGALVVGGAARVLRSLAPAERAGSPAVHAAAVLAPPLVAFVGCIALAFPAPFSAACHCAAHGLHHPHLCLRHPDFAQPLAAPAALLVATWLALTAPRVIRVLREAVTAARLARAIRKLPASHIAGVPIRTADCGAPSAFTVGALLPVIVIDRGLLGTLNEEARQAIAHHEAGHAARRDTLTLLALRLAAALFPMPGARQLIDAWRDAAERACDAHAASQLGDPGAVAAALVAVERERWASGALDVVPPVLALGAPAGAALEQRVHALLDAGEGEDKTPPRLGNDTVAVGAGALAAALLAAVWPGDLVHHAVETLLGWLVH